MVPAPATKTIDPNSPAYQRIHQQARDLEGVFLNTLMKEMFASIGSDDNADSGDSDYAQSTWRDMQAEQLANAVADRGGVGLADQLMPELLRLQEAAQSTTGTGLQS